MKKLLFALFFVMFLVQPVIATLGLGVQPSRIDVYISDEQQQVYLPLKIWNEGTDDGLYTLLPEGLEDFVVDDCSLEDFWCSEREYRINGTGDRFYDFEVVRILFRKSTVGEKEVEGAIYLKAKPYNYTPGMLNIEPQIMVPVYVYQYEENPPYTYPVSSGNGGSPSPPVGGDVSDENDTIIPSVHSTYRDVIITTTTTTIYETTDTTLNIEQDNIQKGNNNGLIALIILVMGVVGVFLVWKYLV